MVEEICLTSEHVNKNIREQVNQKIIRSETYQFTASQLHKFTQYETKNRHHPFVVIQVFV